MIFSKSPYIVNVISLHQISHNSLHEVGCNYAHTVNKSLNSYLSDYVPLSILGFYVNIMEI